MQEFGYPSYRGAKKSNRMEWEPRDDQEPGSPMETETQRAEPHFPHPENALTEVEAEIFLFPLLFHLSISCHHFPLTKLSHEPALMRPRKCGL